MNSTIIAERTFSGWSTERKERVVFTAKIHHLKGNRRAYFSLTFDAWEFGHREQFACGCGGEEYEACLTPEDREIVRILRKWHLCDDDGTPMHYVANALYWSGCSGWCHGKPNDPPNWEHFCSTIVWGGAPVWDSANAEAMRTAFDDRNAETLTAMLNQRLTELQSEFIKAMEVLKK